MTIPGTFDGISMEYPFVNGAFAGSWDPPSGAKARAAQEEMLRARVGLRYELCRAPLDHRRVGDIFSKN